MTTVPWFFARAGSRVETRGTEDRGHSSNSTIGETLSPGRSEFLVDVGLDFIMDTVTCGTLGNVLPGSLLGPVTGLTFSKDGGLLFACSGSSLWVYDVRSGALLSTIRVFMPGVTVYGMDVGRQSFAAIFGEKCVRVVDAVPTGRDIAEADAAATLAWFQGVVHLPDLDDRVWDARLVDPQEGQGGGAMEVAPTNSTTGDMDIARSETGNQVPLQEGKREEDGKRRGRRAGMGLLAVALAHNLVEVWDWVSQARPLLILRTLGGDPCLLYHARLWGRTLDDLKVAAGTAFNQVLVWNPGQASTKATEGDSPGLEEGRTSVLPTGDVSVLRLQGHEGVIFRVAWREDGRRLVSASDDRTVRVWEVQRSGGGRGASGDEGKGNEGTVCEGQLLWTGWGHASRVWDVGFTRLGVVSCGEDGAAIVWRESNSDKDAADTAAEAAAAQTVSTTQALPTRIPPTALDHGRQEGGQLVPVATMRGHSGVNTWRLALHEFDFCDGASSADAPETRREERDSDRWGLTLMATGGNDGTCKLWDLGFEWACDRRQRWGKRRRGTLWGHTEPIPTTDQHITAGPFAPDTVLICDKACAADTHEGGHHATASTATHTLPVASAATPAADRNEKCSTPVAAAATGEPTKNPTEPEPSSNARSSPTPSPHQTASCSNRQERGGQEHSRIGASRRRGVRRRQKKPVVVREVKLTPPFNSGTGVAAVVLLADGSVWWVPDLQVGTWEMVTVSMGDAAVADGVTGGGFLSSAGVSAVAVVGLPPGENYADKENTTSSDLSGERVAGKKDSGGCGSGGEVAIVAGRDDGWLFLLSRGRPRPTVDTDRRTDDLPPSQPRAWRVSAAWKGNCSRVTAVWAVGDAAQSRSLHAPAGGSQAFTAALETSRLSKRCVGGIFDGALVSAAADGTLAYWEWPCSRQGRNTLNDCESGSGSEEVKMPAPRLRMVCQAGAGAAVTSVAIEDRRQPRYSPQKIDHGGSEPRRFAGSPDETEGIEDVPSLGAVVFCGDTKGSIQCFLEARRQEGCIDDRRDEDTPAAGRVSEGLKEAIQPCLVLKRQHGKDQVSRLALRGNCLFSAGHDGQVNHYVVSYSISSPGMLAIAEARRFCSAASPGRHAPGEGALPSSIKPIDLTIVTTYSTAPITTVSELWVGGDGKWEEGPKRAAGGREGQVRVAVAGRSGSSRMSVWDLTEGRQILELECGDKHLAQDLALSWPFTSVDDASVLDQGKNSNRGTLSKAVVEKRHGEDGNSTAGGALCPESPAAPLSRRGIAFAPRLLVLPRHTFVFAEPFLSRGGTNVSSKDSHIIAGKEAITGAAGSSSPENKNDPLAVLVGEMKGRRQPQRQGKQEQRLGLALAFHSSFFPTVRSASKLQAAAKNVGDSPAAGVTSESTIASAVAAPADQPTAAAEKAARTEDAKDVAAIKDNRERSSYHPKGVLQGGNFETVDDGVGGFSVSHLPGRFGYSLGKPFHSQRSASVKFVIPGAPAARLESGQRGFASDVRLITGGEDGTVKLLQVFYERPKRSSAAQAAADPASERFHHPYAKVVQTLPSHESSVGALAVGIWRHVLGAWKAGAAEMGATWADLAKNQWKRPVRHRAQDYCRGTIFVAGDSGGGVTVFQLQHYTAADGSAGGGGRRKQRSRPAGRWTTSGERPVLSLAYARVPSSAAPDMAVHLIATGDTGGTVTLWEFLPGHGSGVLAPIGGRNVRGGASDDVRGTFVHRGPAGKRRGGNGMSAHGAAAEEPPICPGLVPVLSYRAHQMGVLCMAVHVPPEGGRMVIVTGGDDQAVCVAEVELQEYSTNPIDEGSTQGATKTCLNENTSPGKRRFGVRLVGGRPETTHRAAGSAIKGISIVPANSPGNRQPAVVWQPYLC
eukprot:g12836.t3